MTEKQYPAYPFDRRIVYASLIIIILLAVVTHLSTIEAVDIVTLFFIAILALSNISYLYMKLKKPKK